MGNSRYKPADVQHLEPESLAMVRSTGSDATVVVELWGADQKPIVFGSLPYISLTVSSTASSLVTFIGASWPTVDVVGGRLYVASGSAVRYNFGAVNGTLATSMAPTTSSPGILAIGETLLFGRFSGIQSSGSISATVTVDSEFPTAAALAQNTATPTTTVVGSMNQIFDGTNWDFLAYVADDGAGASPTPLQLAGWAVETDGTDPTTVSAEGDSATIRSDRARRLLVSTVHPRLFSANGAYGAAQTNASVQAAPGANLSNYITDISFTNGAVAGYCKLISGSGGATLWECYPAINGGMVVNFRQPIRMAANTALCFTSTTLTTHGITVNGFIAP